MYVICNDLDAHYMWIWIQKGIIESHVAIFYFSLAYLPLASLGESPYLPFYDDIIRFTNCGDIILRKFNAHTKNEQTTLFDSRKTMYGDS